MLPFPFPQQAPDAEESDNDPDKIYKVATRNLREHHGVANMTPEKLIKTLALLQMGPRRLVCKGLAPTKLLPAAIKEPRVPLGDEETDEDLGETVYAEMEMMTVEEKVAGSGDEEADDRAALLAADIALSPNEARSLLDALGVHPRRFVKLGLVDAEDLPRGRHGRGPQGGRRCGGGGCCGGGQGLEKRGCGARFIDRKPCLDRRPRGCACQCKS